MAVAKFHKDSDGPDTLLVFTNTGDSSRLLRMTKISTNFGGTLSIAKRITSDTAPIPKM